MTFRPRFLLIANGPNIPKVVYYLMFSVPHGLLGHGSASPLLKPLPTTPRSGGVYAPLESLLATDGLVGALQLVV